MRIDRRDADGILPDVLGREDILMLNVDNQ